MKIKDFKNQWDRRGIIIPGTKTPIENWDENFLNIEKAFFKHSITDQEKSFCEKIQTEDSITGTGFDLVLFFSDDSGVDMPKIYSIQSINIFVSEQAGNFFSRKRISFPLLLFSHVMKNL